jgi:methylmalonyl-CoA/ethylmalonyl-CoA epimerase
MVELIRIDHIGVPVWSADDSLAFYDTTGTDVVHDAEIPEYNIRAVFLEFDGTYLEFLEPTGPGNVKTFLERHGPGFQHIAYGVPDINEAVQSLQNGGISFQSDEPVDGAGDARIIFVEERHTAGLQVELVERHSPV